MFKKGDFLYWLDFNKNKFGDVLKFEITGEGKVKNEQGDEVEVYYTLCKKEKGEIPKEFAEKKMKGTRKELIDDSIAKCERFIKFHESALKESKEKIKETKEQIKFLKK